MRNFVIVIACFLLSPANAGATTPADQREAKLIVDCFAQAKAIVSLVKFDGHGNIIDEKINSQLTGLSNECLLMTAQALLLFRDRQEAETRGVLNVLDRGFWQCARKIALSKSKDSKELFKQLKEQRKWDGGASLRIENLEREMNGLKPKW